jgi:seryl-tRNA synthetase
VLDLKRIREDPDGARKALARRGAADDLDEVLRLDARRRELLPEIEGGRAKQNKANDAIAEAKRSGGDAESAIVEMREVAAKVKEQERELGEVEAAREKLLVELPNFPHPDVPEGETDEDAKVLREVGNKPEFSFEPLDHLELGERHGWINMEAAAELSGSRFAYLLGDLAMLELILVRFVMETVRAEGFTPAIPPVLVREQALYGTGFFPGERETIYEVPKDELFLVGTSEVSLAGLHAGEKDVLGDELPLRYAGFSTCFRRESGAGGRDTRGIFRVHQFDKVEMFSFVHPDESDAEHERLLAIQEKILTALELPYRVVDIPLGDLGAPASRKFDCEAWIPSQERYREVTSCSNTTDFQARRLNARFRPKAEAPPEYMHTLNGTAVAVGRTLIALLENGQTDDGSVVLPAALVQFGAASAIPTT